MAATAENDAARNQVYNVAYGERTSLTELFELIQQRVAGHYPETSKAKPTYRDFRAGDVRHSLADIGKARELIGYTPEFSIAEGLDKAAQWYINKFM